jgi:N-acyl-D-amino-acid deacylase
MFALNRRCFLHSAAVWPLLSINRLSGETPSTGIANPALSPFDDLLTSFIEKHKVPGAALAVSRNGKLVYARGYGYADVEKKLPVRPTSLFRIASVSKPFTGVAVMQLVERRKIGLDDLVLKHIKLMPHLERKAEVDPRWKTITVRQCLQHTGGWDRDKSFDPIGIPHQIARALKIAPNVSPDAIVRYMMGKPLDFDPGSKYAYSNLGYLVLSRVMEAVTGDSYEAFVKKEIFGEVGIKEMSLARDLQEKRPKNEVKYYTTIKGTEACLYPPRVGEQVSWPEGASNVEGYEAHGGWISSAPDLLRFACAFDQPAKCPLLKPDTIMTMFARPDGAPGHDAKGKPKTSYYGCGWSVVDLGRDRLNTWHTGYIPGQNSILVRRFDGINWAVLFNIERNPNGQNLTGLIDGRMHEAADAVKKWPDHDLFGKEL